MANIIKKIKIKKEDDTFTDYIPIGAEAENVNVDGESVEVKLNKTPYYYNSVADMKADEKLKVGDMVITLGYYEANDGGGAEYRIVNDSTLTDDGGSIHDLINGYKAVLIVKNKILIMEQFGIKGNTTDNSNCNVQFQALLDYAAEKYQIQCSKKTYYLYGIIIPAGTYLDGNGATFMKPNLSIEPYNMTVGQMKNARMLRIQAQQSEAEQPLTEIKNLICDGNAFTMWSPSDGYAQEQASLIIVFGNTTYTSKINVKFFNVRVQNNVSDGFHIRDRANVSIENCSSYKCFRGGLTITGGDSIIKVNGFNFYGDDDCPDGIDIETDSGLQTTYPNKIFLQDITMNRDLDLASPGHNDLVVVDGLYFEGHGSPTIDGTTAGMTIKNSYFHLIDDDASLSLREVNNEAYRLTFENCVFEGTVTYDENDGSFVSGSVINNNIVYEQETGFPMRHIFRNCTFRKWKTISGSLSHVLEVIFDNCIFEDNFAKGYSVIGASIGNVSFAPNILKVMNCIFYNTLNRYIQCSSIYDPDTRVYIQNNTFVNPIGEDAPEYYFHFQQAIVYWNQIFDTIIPRISGGNGWQNRNMGTRITYTTDTTLPTQQTKLSYLKGEDRYYIMNDTRQTILAEYYYNTTSGNWVEVFNNISTSV